VFISSWEGDADASCAEFIFNPATDRCVTCGKSKAEHSEAAIDAGRRRRGSVQARKASVTSLKEQLLGNKPREATSTTEETEAPRNQETDSNKPGRTKTAEERAQELASLTGNESFKEKFRVNKAAISSAAQRKFQGTGTLHAREGHIVLNPPSRHYRVRVVGAAGNEAGAVDKSPGADGQVDLSELNPGHYDMTVYTDTEPPIQIGPTRRIEKQHKSVRPTINKLPVTTVPTVFHLSDKPLQNELIKFEFVSSDGQKAKFEGRTDDDGSAGAPLPAGIIHNFRAEDGSESGKVLIERTEAATVPKPVPSDPAPTGLAPNAEGGTDVNADAVKPLPILISEKCTSFAPIIDLMCNSVTKALILGTVTLAY
jgi:hypothetical protein